MADADKTEKPTPKRLGEARQKGNVARSVDLNAASGLAVCVIGLHFLGGQVYAQLQSLMYNGLSGASVRGPFDANSVMVMATSLGWQAAKVVLPFAALSALTALVVGGWQTRWLFSTHTIKPNPGVINPMHGLKRLFGPQGAVEVVKSLVKAAVIGGVTWLSIHGHVAALAALTGAPPGQIAPEVGSLVAGIATWVAFAYLVIGLVDRRYQYHKWIKGLMMSKQEIKQEARQAEASPEIKGAVKARQRQAAQRRMLKRVPDADVVITNPTHYAVALAYDPGEHAPRVVAKGVDLFAKRIREEAAEHGVPIMPDPPLARQLHDICELEQFIPGDLFVAVAQILAFVFRQRDLKAARRAR